MQAVLTSQMEGQIVLCHVDMYVHKHSCEGLLATGPGAGIRWRLPMAQATGLHLLMSSGRFLQHLQISTLYVGSNGQVRRWLLKLQVLCDAETVNLAQVHAPLCKVRELPSHA